jgi:2-polyprenyl-3-methyl-5-hydroxy-6-metoxy-1,4-benzoquinol methylase
MSCPSRIPDDWYATAKILQPQGDERVLDIACGSGRHSLELRCRGFCVGGLDISPDLIEIARRDAVAAASTSTSSSPTSETSSSTRSSTLS